MLDKNNRPTMQDIAEKVGVSKALVDSATNELFMSRADPGRSGPIGGTGTCMRCAGTVSPTPPQSSKAISPRRPVLPLREQLLTGHNLPTAVIAGNNRIAIGLLDALRRAGVDVPGDTSVVGYDDRLDGHRTELRSIVLQPRLAVRATTAPAR